jgi:hypothetical protein
MWFALVLVLAPCQSQEMQNQVEAMCLNSQSTPEQESKDRRLSRLTVSSSPGSDDNQEMHGGVTSDGVGFYTSDKWAKFYPNQDVAVVTSIGQPPIPPEGERLAGRRFKEIWRKRGRS